LAAVVFGRLVLIVGLAILMPPRPTTDPVRATATPAAPAPVGQPRATPTVVVPHGTGPPRMVLRTAGGAEQAGGNVAYCWGDAGNWMCVNLYPFWWYPHAPLAVAPGEPLTLRVDALGPLDQLTWRVYRFEERVPNPDGWDAVGQATPVREGTVSHPTSPIPLPRDLTLGHYVIEVAAYPDPRGDTIQGFNVVIDMASP
jgi:hypothetical protein